MSCNARKEEKRINLKDLFAFKDSSYVTFWKEVMKISATNVTWCARQIIRVLWKQKHLCSLALL